MRTLTANRKKLNKEAMRKILNEAYPQGCMSTSCHFVVKVNADDAAKTGQALIANPIFDSLPSTPTPSTDESMQVDSASTPAPTTEGEDKEKDTPKSSTRPRYIAPVDGQTEDLILEGTAYLRLLLILLNLDAGKVEEVSPLECTNKSLADDIGRQV